MDIESIFKKIETEMKNGYSPPNELFYKMDLTNPLDKENYGYIQNGEVGGYYRWLALLVRFMQPKCILELGSRYGVSSVMLYSELPKNSTLISVDIDQDQRYIPEEMWEDKRVRFVYGDCFDLNIYRGSIPVNIDVFWTDTVHNYEQIRDEFEIYEPLLADESIIVIDDINLNDKKLFFDESQYDKYNLTHLCHSTGFGVIHYSRKDKTPKSPEFRQIQASLRSIAIWKRKDQIPIQENLRPYIKIFKRFENLLISILKERKKSQKTDETADNGYLSYEKHNSQYLEEYNVEKMALVYGWCRKTNLFNHPQYKFLDLIAKHPEVRRVAIDIGSGGGWISAELSKFFHQIIAIEPSYAALEISQNLFPQSKYPNIKWEHGFSEEVLQTIHLLEPSLFVTCCVLSHMTDDVVEKICAMIESIAPKGSILAFGETWGRESHELMWHIRTPYWWQKNLPSWELDFFGPEIENICGRHKGFHGIKIK